MKQAYCSDARYAATAGSAAALPTKPVPRPVRTEARLRIDLALSSVSGVEQSVLSCC